MLDELFVHIAALSSRCSQLDAELAALSTDYGSLLKASNEWEARCSALQGDADALRLSIKRMPDEFAVIRLAGTVCEMIDRGAIDARSLAGDALLNYASGRYGDERPIRLVRETWRAARLSGTSDT